MDKKIVMLGKFGVGKTSMIFRLVENKFSPVYQSSIGVTISKKSCHLGDQTINLIIWDIAGEQSSAHVSKSYLKGAHGVMYVIDKLRPKSYEDLAKALDQIKMTTDNAPVIIAINKSDLQTDKSLPPIDAMIDTDIPIFNTSAKTGLNVESAFQKLCELTAPKIPSNA